MRIILLISLLVSQKGFSSPSEYEAQKAHALLNAKSIHQLKFLLSDVESQDWRRKLCESQLESKTLPTKCYEYLHWQKKSQQISKAEFRSRETLLDRFCSESLESIRSLNDSRLIALKRQDISSDCRNQILGIKKRLEYQAFDSDRRALFFRTK